MRTGAATGSRARSALPDPRVASARISRDSASGRIETAWRRSGKDVTLNLTVPANTVAQAVLPRVDAVYGAGRHRFTVRRV